jgi:hypothetical protein
VGQGVVMTVAVTTKMGSSVGLAAMRQERKNDV